MFLNQYFYYLFVGALILPQQILTKFILQITNMFENQTISARFVEFENLKSKKKNPPENAHHDAFFYSSADPNSNLHTTLSINNITN